jgi:tetratricopeptide (TPR) repeat protein
MGKLYNAAFFLFFISITSLLAQSEVVFEKSTRENFIITFQPGNRPEYQTTNFIIREIARITNRNVMAVEYTINYRQDITIRKSGNKYTTIIILKDFRLTGSTRIHAFDITDVLIPEQVEFYGTVSFPRAKTYSIKQSPTRLNPAETRFTFETIDSTSAGRPNYSMDELKYIYSSSNRRNFSEKATLIEEYYYSDVRLGQIFGDLSNIFAQNYKRCYEYRQMLDAMGMALSDMYQKDFANRLELYVNDPISLMPKLSNASRLLEQKIYEVDNVIMNLPIYYFNDGVRLIPININEARWHFEQALQIDPYFAPAIAQIARLEFNNGQTDLAISSVKRAYSIGSFDNDTRNLLQQLSINIDDRLIADAVQYETKRDHQNALAAYLKAQDFCKSVPSLSCKDIISRGITLSRIGIYSDLMSNANSLYRSGKFDMAENTVKQAIEFQKNYNRDITNANDAYRLLNEIKEKQYARNIDQGISNLNNNMFAQALQLFEAAKEIEENFNVAKNEELISLIKQAKRPLIVQNLEQAIRQAKSNLLSQAREVIQTAGSDIYKYGFSEDEELRELLNTARLEIQSQHCINIQNQITSMLGSANEQISQQNFLSAENYFSQAKDLNEKNPDCNIDFLFVERRRAEVLPAIQYQQMLVKVDNHIKKAEYSQAIDLYNKSTNQFNHNGLSKFKLTHYTLLDFTLRQHDCFVLCAISYFVSIKQSNNALILLNNIEQRKFPRKKTRNEQEALGKLLAQIDHSENPMIKPKTKVKEYTKGKYFYRYLRKAYLKEFKTL